jgi:hypothetical protein
VRRERVEKVFMIFVLSKPRRLVRIPSPVHGDKQPVTRA